jgi:hypothetical protein
MFENLVDRERAFTFQGCESNKEHAGAHGNNNNIRRKMSKQKEKTKTDQL